MSIQDALILKVDERFGGNCVTCLELVRGLHLGRTTRAAGGKSDGPVADADGLAIRRCDSTNALGWQRGGGCVDGGGGARVSALPKRVSAKIGNGEEEATDDCCYQNKQKEAAQYIAIALLLLWLLGGHTHGRWVGWCILPAPLNSLPGRGRRYRLLLSLWRVIGNSRGRSVWLVPDGLIWCCRCSGCTCPTSGAHWPGGS